LCTQRFVYFSLSSVSLCDVYNRRTLIHTLTHKHIVLVFLIIIHLSISLSVSLFYIITYFTFLYAHS
jgi:hypothetical protein